MGGGGGQPKIVKQESEPDPMLQYLKQMQKQQKVVVKDVDAAQREALLESQRQSAIASARQGEMGAQQMLSQAGAMQQAKDIAAQQAQQQAAAVAGSSAIGGGFDIGKAQQEQAANLAGMGAIPASKLPFYGMSDASSAAPAARSANIFNLPKSSGLTFGGQ